MIRGTLTLVLVAGLAALAGCGEDEPTAPSVPSDLRSFSGSWVGVQDVVRIGDCLFNGSDSTSTPVTLSWSVDSDGRTTGTQTSPRNADTWAGTIGPDLAVSLRKRYEITCNDVARPDSVLYEGAIVMSGGRGTLVFQASEVWCPTLRCLFRVRYSLAQD